MTLESRRPVAVVTGASAGVGRATVRALATHGYVVALLACGVDGLEAARREVEAAGSRAIVLPTDVADADRVEAAAVTAERELGPIDIAVGADQPAPILSTLVWTDDNRWEGRDYAVVVE